MEYDKTKLIRSDRHIAISENRHFLDGALFSTEIKRAKVIKKRKNFTWLFLAINVAIVAAIFVYQFGFHETKPLSELFAEKPFYRYFFISLGILVAYYLATGLGYSIFLKRATGKFRYGLGVEMGIVGKYWDYLTPFGTGGQFAQIAYCKKYGVSSDISTGIVVSRYMISMIAFTMVGVAVLFVPITTFTTGKIIKVMAAVGIAINLVITAFVWLVSMNRKICLVLVVGGLKLLHKMRIVKNYQSALRKSLRFIRQYQKAFAYFLKNPLVFFCELFLSLIELIGLALISYMIYLAFNPNGGVSPVTILAMAFLCSFATSYIPLPGGSGAAEISFAALFSTLFTESATFWALIFWRILTYYIVILVGFVFTITEPAIYAKINRSKIKTP